MDNKKKTALKYILGAIGLVIMIGGVLYFMIIRQPGDDASQKEDEGTSYKLDVSVLKSDFLKGLTRYADFPITPRFPGRKNPFEPY